MLSAEENALLTQVESDAAMGLAMRRYWVPVALSEEFEADGAPRAIRLLGERLVAFRDSDGRIGLLDEHCPHRGASLVLARNENCALQCIYHGWRVAADGTILDTPTEQPESTFKDRVRQPAYPVRESGGLVWAYLGPVDLKPPLPSFAWSDLPIDSIMIMKSVVECNWAQALEGAIDSAHSNYLHSDGILPSDAEEVTGSAAGSSGYLENASVLFRPTNDGRPRLEAQNTSYGFAYAAIRRPLADADTQKYVRITKFVAPFWVLLPAPQGWGHAQAFIPLDDENTMLYHFKYRTDATPITTEERVHHIHRAGLTAGADIDESYRKVRNAGNLWMQDREAMRSGSYSGIHGVQNQDSAVQESMGSTVDRTREHLGTTDVAVIRMRRVMLANSAAIAAGETPLGLAGDGDFRRIMGLEEMMPIEADWRRGDDLATASAR